MHLFDHPDDIFAFLHENLPEPVKYEFLYELPIAKPKYISSDYNEKYGEKRVPFRVFLDLEKYGYAHTLISHERSKDNDIKERYLINWSAIQKAIHENDFLTTEKQSLKLVSISEAAELLGITRQSIYKIIKKNEIPVVEIFDRTKRIKVKDLLGYIERKKYFMK